MARYTVQAPDGSTITLEGPEGAPQEQVIAMAQRLHGERATKRADAVAMENAQEKARFAQEEADRPWAQRMAANVGAGFDTAYEGAKQLIGRGGSDEQIKADRALKEQLAEGTTGGGIGQIVGEVAPTLAIPAGAVGAGARGAAALAGRGLPKALARFLPAADAAVMGGAAGALAPVTSDESRTLNAGIGAVGGAALPAVVGAGRVLKRTLSRGGAAERAGEELADRAGGNMQRDLSNIATANPDIPLSTAATAGNTELAMAERASRARNPAAWAEKDADTGRAVWDQVERATENLADIPAHKTVRRSNWAARSTEAMNAVDPQVWQQEAGALRQAIDQASRSPEGMIRLKPTLAVIRDVMDSPDFSPQHLAELRKVMGQSVKGPSMPGQAFDRSVQNDPLYLSLRDAMDDVLSKSSGGKWDRVNPGYRADSTPINQGEASAAIRARFENPTTGEAVAGEIGGVPKVSAHRLSQAMNARGVVSKFGDELAPGSRNRLTATMDALRKQGITQDVKTAGTGGGGSNTTMDLLASGAQHAMGLGPVLGTLKALVTGRGDRLMNEELDRLLQNPAQYVQAIQQLQQRGQPPSFAQRELMQMLSQASAATPAALLQQ